MHVAYRVWIEEEGKIVFGLGIYQLLMLVRQTGSLSDAVKELKMSYRWAWGKVRDYENRLGITLLERGRHGQRGASLTDEGNKIVDLFGKILDEMDRMVSRGTWMELIDEIRNLKNES
jgi:molybdate transport system regulatory protein